MTNNKIIGQILRNKYGSLKTTKIEEIIETVADSGLRLINTLLTDEEEIADLARYLRSKFPDHDVVRVKELLLWFSFFWTIANVEQIVRAINIREIRAPVKAVVKKASTPAYDLIGYFSQLDSAKQLTNNEREQLSALLKKHDNAFLKRVLSIRTQQYMNTHRSKAVVEQAVCALLDVKFIHRLPGRRM